MMLCLSRFRCTVAPSTLNRRYPHQRLHTPFPAMRRGAQRRRRRADVGRLLTQFLQTFYDPLGNAFSFVIFLDAG